MKLAINIQDIVSEKECYETVRSLRWPEDVYCPYCESKKVKRNGGSLKQRYYCHSCEKHFDDLTLTIFTGSKLPLKSWILCLYFMGLNLSNAQIAQELDICEPTAQSITEQLREGIAKKSLIYDLKEKLK